MRARRMVLRGNQDAVCGGGVFRRDSIHVPCVWPRHSRWFGRDALYSLPTGTRERGRRRSGGVGLHRMLCRYARHESPPHLSAMRRRQMELGQRRRLADHLRRVRRGQVKRGARGTVEHHVQRLSRWENQQCTRRDCMLDDVLGWRAEQR